MYSRRIKLNKKKPKPTKQKPNPGSNWGPRLALIERERALAGGAVLEEDEEELYDVQHELVYNVKKSAKQSQSHPHQQTNTHSSNYSGSGGSGRSNNNNDIDPVLRLGRSSSPNYYYNYSRRAAPNASGTRKISCPEPSSTRHYQKTPNHLEYQQAQQHQRRASYVLGSSSGYCSGSVTTLSTCVNNGNPEPNFEQFNKPLTLIIPSQERYDCFNNGKKINKSQKLRNVEFDDFGVEEQSQDSFPSSSAYQSSGDEGEGERYRHHEKREMNNRAMGPKRHFHNPMANMKSSSGGILQISTKEAVVQVHAPPPGSPQIPLEEGTEPETLEMGAEENDINAKSGEGNNSSKDKTGQTITALAQGITMVYVPMEAENNNKGVNISVKDNSDDNNMNDSEYGEDPLPEYNEPVDLPELGQHSDDCSASTSSSSRGSASGGGGKVGSNEPEQDSLSSNFILKRKVPDQLLGADSLLDSFDSILFKPKPGEALSKSQERCQSQLPTLPEHKGIRKRPEQPPPLPPGNGSGHKPMEKQKNLRFALENLETVLNPSLRTLSSGDEQNEQPTPPPAPKKVLKKVTLSLPGADNISSRNHELLLNYEELNNCSSEILSCGHVRNDDYSTLSSLTSSAQEISDFDDLGSNHGANSNHSGEVEVASNHGGSESDAGSAKNNTSSNKSSHEPRSVLQQLRDLSRLIRGNSPTKHNAQQQQQQQQAAQPQPPSKTKENSSHVHFTEANSFFLHRPSPSGVEGEAKRKSSDATDNSADSGKGSGSGTSGSGSSGPEGSSASSAEPSPNNSRGGCGAPNSNCTSGVSAKIKHSRRLHIATIRGRGGGTGSHHHYTLCPDDEDYDGHCQEETCSQQSGCSCQECCDYRSDCNECQMYNNKPPVAGFPKPSNSEELCSNETASNGSVGGVRKKQAPNSTPKTSRPPSRIVRRRSSRVTAVRRTASLKKSKFANANGGSSSSHNNRKPVILDYCDCSNCDLADLEFEDEDEEMMHNRLDRGCCSDKNCRPAPAPPHHRHEPLLIPIKNSGKCKSKSRIPNPNVNAQGRKISTSSGSSGVSSASSAGKVSRISAFRSSAAASVKQQAQTQQQQHQSSQLLRKSDAASTGAALSNPTSVVPIPLAGNLFTIDEANEDSVYGESGTAVVIGKGARSTSKQQQQPLPAVPREFQLHHDQDEESFDENVIQNMPPKRPSNSRSHTQHSHPKCWLAPDATLGWSDLESLYSQNMKVDGKAPPVLRDECPTCWKELSEMKKNCPDPNRTVDRTKRMFIWLNRRHKEFHAPWWEAKKQASMRWLVTKAFAHVPKDKVPDPFKESKKGKPTKYSLRDEIVKGLVTGKLYCMSLDSLYRSQQNNYHLSQNLTHWEIIKILSRRGIYIAQPSDMKLTETTLRQKKPIRTAAHIALIEAMMGLYAKEILGRDRIAATLRSFGKIIDPDTNSPERLVISWINTAVTTLKSYILSNAQQHLASNKVNRWLNLPDVGEIRDLCDGVGICALFALYCSNDLKVDEISVPEPGDTLTIYDSITNHSLVQKLCDDLFPEPIYHLCVTDFLYIHGCMKQNILCFLVDLFVHLEINPILRVNRLTHVPIRVEL